MQTNGTLSRTREIILDDVSALKKDAVKIATDVKDRAQAHVDETRQKWNDSLKLARETATAHPLALLGIGIALGFLIARRRA